MSHTSAVKSIKFTNLDALRAAVEELNGKGIKMTLVPNAKPRAYFQNQQGMEQADFVIQLGGSRYDIGLYKQADGSYESRTDFWGGDVEKLLGAKAGDKGRADQAKMGKLFQTYGVHAALQQARKQGLQASRVAGADGKEQVIVTGYR